MYHNLKFWETIEERRQNKQSESLWLAACLPGTHLPSLSLFSELTQQIGTASVKSSNERKLWGEFKNEVEELSSTLLNKFLIIFAN